MGGEVEAKVRSRGVYSAWSVGSVLLRGLLCGAGLSAASLAFQGSQSLLAGGERGSLVARGLAWWQPANGRASVL